MREFLKGLELDGEVIDKIMAEHGKYITGLKEQIDGYKEKETKYEEDIKQLNDTIEQNNKSLEDYSTLTNENKDLKAQLQMSKKMHAAGVFLAVASAALIATGGVALVNDKNYGHFLMMGGVVSIPFGAVMMLVSHASYSSAIIHYNRPEE